MNLQSASHWESRSSSFSAREGRGVSPTWEKEADVRLTLPLEGSVESLNVAVTAGVILFEAMRQRRKTGETVNR